MTTQKEKFSDILSRIPDEPGVYLYRNIDGKVIYIGKAKSLRKRVRSYFAKTHPDPKTRTLVSKIEDIEYIVVDSEAEAFILEANLVRRYKPRYNIDLKDDKRFPYLKITNEDYPRIKVVRRKIRDGSEYFGPYTEVRPMRKVLDSLNHHFLLRHCNDPDPTKRDRPCLYRDIGRCIAPCSGDVTKEEYAELLDNVRLFLKGRRDELVAHFTKSMAKAAEDMDFEQAARYRDAIESVESVLRPQKIDTGLQNRDIIGAALSQNMAAFSVFRIRDGAIMNHHRFTAKAGHESRLPDLLYDFISQLYAKLGGDVPPEVLVQRMPKEPEELGGFLSEMSGHKVQLMTPKRGTPLGLLKLARQNARLAMSEALAQKGKHHVPFAIHALQKELGLSRLPIHIEAFDISNIGEKSRVAGMVYFKDGKPKRSQYRNYLIKTVEGQDDPACMKEVVGRRISRLIREEKELPDLILIDGGRTQLNAAIQALRENRAMDKLDIISIAKRLEEIFVPQFPDPVSLAKDSAAIKLLQRIRDEVHDHAISYHRKVRAKNSFKSMLEEVPGIGPKRRDGLLRSYRSIADIKKDSPEGIKEKTGMSLDLARKLLDFLKTTAAVMIPLFFVMFTACAPSVRYFSDTFETGSYNPESDAIKQAERGRGDERPVIAKEQSTSPKAKADKDSKTKTSKIAKKDDEPLIPPIDDPVTPPPADNNYRSPTGAKSDVIHSKGRRSTVPKDDKAQRIMGSVNYYIGTPYVYGGESAMGMDCSGLTQTVYREALQLDLPRTVSQQIEEGRRVSTNAMDFGDLIFFKMESRSPDHVGIYLGDNRFVHASESRGVTISRMSDYYQKRLYSARRVE